MNISLNTILYVLFYLLRPGYTQFEIILAPLTSSVIQFMQLWKFELGNFCCFYLFQEQGGSVSHYASIEHSQSQSNSVVQLSHRHHQEVIKVTKQNTKLI